MKKYILFLLTFCYLIGSNLLYAQSGCGDPVSGNYYCSENPGACPFDFSQGFPVFYLPATFVDDGSCIYDGVDENGDGIPDNSLQGCESPGYYNYNSNFVVFDPASYVNTYADQQSEICIPFTYGCTDSAACNYNTNANADDVSNPCILPLGCDTCSGETDGTGTVVDNDADDDGVCDADEIVGCTDNNPGGDGTPIACNYNPSATDSDNSLCTYPSENYLDCDGNCNNDTDEDGVCDEIEVSGCQDEDACNYNASATDTGSCTYPIDLYGVDYVDCSNECLNDTDGDGVCDEIEVSGCTDGAAETNGGIACNYDASATDDDGSCEYPWDDCPNQQLLESFGDYNQGNIDPQSNNWIGWDNSNSGVDIVDFSMSTYLGDSQSILVEQDDDLIWDFDDVNAGSGQVIFHMYIPSDDNAGAYYNMLHDYAAANSNWAFQVFFAPASSSEQSYVDLDQPVYFDAVYDTWVQVRHEIDIDNDTISLYYNGDLITSWTFSTGSTGFSLVLDALNLYGFCTGTPCNGFTYYDNIEIGTRRVDFFVEENIMVELKAIIKLEEVHLSQTMNYCQAYNLPIGLLINFGSKSLEFKRIFNINHFEKQRL